MKAIEGTQLAIGALGIAMALHVEACFACKAKRPCAGAMELTAILAFAVQRSDLAQLQSLTRKVGSEGPTGG